MDLKTLGITSPFDPAHLRAIRKHFFQDSTHLVAILQAALYSTRFRTWFRRIIVYNNVKPFQPAILLQSTQKTRLTPQI